MPLKAGELRQRDAAHHVVAGLEAEPRAPVEAHEDNRVVAVAPLDDLAVLAWRLGVAPVIADLRGEGDFIHGVAFRVLRVGAAGGCCGEGLKVLRPASDRLADAHGSEGA